MRQGKGASSNKGHRWPGVPYALVSAMLFGAAPPLSKLLADAVAPFMLAGLLYLGAGVGLAALRLLTPISSQEGALQRTDLPWLAGAVVSGGMAGPVLLMAGLARSSASSSALLLNLEGLATMGIAWIVFRETVDRRLLLGAFAILLGALLISWDGGALSLNPGALFIAGACLAWGIDNNLTRKISAANPVTITIIKGCIAGSTNVAIAYAAGVSLPSSDIVAGAVLIGFFCVGASLVLFILALRHLGTARTGAYFSLAPFIGAILAIAMLGEPVTMRLALAALLMGLGLWLHLAERHDHEHVHDMIEHDHAHTHDDHHAHVHDGSVEEEPHSHWHRHQPLRHRHGHYPDLHHRHDHG